MSGESVFKVVLITVFSVFSILRVQYYRLARRAGHRTVIEESLRYSVLLGVFICYEVLTFFIYIFFPGWLSWAGFTLPILIRALGASFSLPALLLFFWVHRSLGHHFSNALRIRENHALVTHGPYHLMRHPMYTAFYLLHISVLFLTANAFMGLTWIAGLTLIIRLRVRREEAMMIEHFGEEYRAYLNRTGRFLPPFLKRLRKGSAKDAA